MQCAHTWSLKAQKINRLYSLSPITTHNRKKNKWKKWACWWVVELPYVLKLNCLLLELRVTSSSPLNCVCVHLFMIEGWRISLKLM
jgi:hypothetical protein